SKPANSSTALPRPRSSTSPATPQPLPATSASLTLLQKSPATPRRPLSPNFPPRNSRHPPASQLDTHPPTLYPQLTTHCVLHSTLYALHSVFSQRFSCRLSVLPHPGCTTPLSSSRSGFAGSRYSPPAPVSPSATSSLSAGNQ